MKTPDIQQISKILGLLLVGLFLGWLFFGGSAREDATDIDQHVEETHTDEEGNIVYTCSMHPQIRQNEPGNCPICGMELIPVDQAEEQGETVFTMTEAAVKLADIQTSTVERRIPELEVRLPGRVAADERRISSITAQFSGRIEELFVDFRGTYVEEGEKLASIYSPELISAQQELLEAARNKQTNPGLYESTLRKLRLWGLPESEIQRIESSGKVSDTLPIVATRSGYVTQKNVDTRDYVDEGTVMYKVADFSTLWVLFDAYETDIGAIDQGDSVNFTVRSYPGKTFEAKITYVDPFIDPQTRTARVRAEVDNTENMLKPDMLARGVVSGTADNGEKIMIPRSAVMWTGKRSVVFVKQEDKDVPSFEPRLVTLGQRAGDYYVIEEGLEEGEEVVTHGNFKLDSAAQLADNLSMMNREPGSGANQAGHDHGGIEEQQIQQEEDHSEHTDSRAEISGINAEVPQGFRNQLKQVVSEYLDLKDALVEDSDPEEVSNHAERFLEQLRNIDMSLLKEKPHDRWMELHEKLSQEAEQIAGYNELNTQRRAFFLLSEALVESVREFSIDGILYYQFCPMAFNGEGAYWLSEEKEINNPYLGKKMPACGEIIEEIKV
ncbi:efflux RND transporter periplasmic adaptor subunit [Aliifodinibius salicampi]|uniref:Efflux RND transporter periplasmic adaptor subunit n=1 Tax=Fodinibius salicampi TaxID=1920655 RepID=A0ABT3PZF4_9BACT|nr:efflux RND transporter periplasmic adaptor subunit [Fodinibius salicampi]MCW9713248.1 efflux RND transporter periplasmic adaptor subunit [Fodinibius salicampi]